MDKGAELDALLARLHHPQLKAIDLSLERMRLLLARLGHPETCLPPVIHIAGTNGKGSLAAFLSAICEQAGYRVHRYTSPHLVRFGERIVVGGESLADETLLPLLKRIEGEAAHQPVTFFEATTAAAFLAFSEAPADLVILETGLGGRLDATNLVAKPLLTAITPIGIDHAEYLGNGLQQIAAEKAGILKGGVACVVGPQEKEALEVIEAVAASRQAPLLRYGREWRVESEGGRFDFRSDAGKIEALVTGLHGGHQQRNAATAIACIQAIRSRFPIDEAAIRAGLRSARWPARLQRLTAGPLAQALAEGDELWLDGGHNPHAAKALAEWAKAVGEDGKPLCLMLGMMAGKDAAGFLSAFQGMEMTVRTVAIPGEASFLAEELARLACGAGWAARAAESPVAALEEWREAERRPKRILIAGSLYLAGRLLKENT